MHAEHDSAAYYMQEVCLGAALAHEAANSSGVFFCLADACFYDCMATLGI